MTLENKPDGLNGSKEFKRALSGEELLKKTTMLLFDTDGILAHSGEQVVEKFKIVLIEELGDCVDLNFHFSQIRHWNQVRNWATERGVSEERAGEIEEAVWRDPNIYQAARPVGGSLELIEWLASDEVGRKVMFYTSRPASLEDVTDEWYKTHFPDIYEREGLDMRSDEGMGGAEFKAEQAYKLAQTEILLVFEGNPFDAVEIADAIFEYGGTVILVPYANVKNPGIAKYTKGNLVVVKRDSDDQNIWTVYEYLSGKDRSALMERYQRRRD